MRITVIGGGHGAHAATVDLTLRGFEVTLYNRTLSRFQPVLEQGGFRYVGALGEGFLSFARITDDLRYAIGGADVIMLVVPSTAHEYYARVLAPYVDMESVVFLNPGHMGGSLHFAAELKRQGNRHEVGICETATLTYGTRIREPGLVWIKRVVQNLYFSAFPARNLSRLCAVLSTVYPSLVPADHALAAAFLDLNAVEHPPGVVLNAGWIEFTRGDFHLYYEGITPGVARVVERVDAERLAVIRALNERAGLGIPEFSFVQYFHKAGYTTAEAAATGSVYQALQASEPNRTTKAPDSFEHRYMVEDVGFGLVPMCELAHLVGVEVPHMESLITLASALAGRDFRREGRTLERMGLAGVPVHGLRSFLQDGWTPSEMSR
jgi:opine dehydrogenase